jgi:pathogenesis-related protein 1
MKISTCQRSDLPLYRGIFILFFLLIISASGFAQTKKVILKDFIFFPFINQVSSDNPLDLPYHSKSTQISITIDEDDDHETVNAFLDEYSGNAMSNGSQTRNGISLGYVLQQSAENSRYNLLTAMVMNISSGAKLMVTMTYPSRNGIARKNSMAMLLSFMPNNAQVVTSPVKPIPNTNEPVDTSNGNANRVNTNPSNNLLNIQAMLDAHNAYRGELGLPSLAWSNELAGYAQKWVNELVKNRNCEISHRPHDEKDPWNQIYGENIYWGSEGYTPLDAVSSWGSEKSFFDTRTKTCKGDWSTCGHYTQLIWKQTTKVGCAIATCSNGNLIVVCNYDPAGNMQGETPY